MLLPLTLIAAAPTLTAASVPDVVAAAVNCYEAVSPGTVQISRLTVAGWAEVLDKSGKPETAGGHLFRRAGFSGEIAAVGRVCSLVAPVKSFDEVQSVLLKLDDAVHPDRTEERSQGIALTKGNKTILFWVGSPTNRTPAAVRIDATSLETK
jgi:hypothetical protein